MIISIISWFLLIELFLFIGLPVVLRMRLPSVDAGIALSIPLGLLVFSLLVWVCSMGFGLAYSRVFVSMLFIASIMLGILYLRQHKVVLANTYSFMRADIWSAQLVFLLVFLAFVALRAYLPQIHFSEKSMDSTFLHYFVRNEILPPEDPWSVGTPMRYYYLGFLLFGTLAKLSGIAPSIVYNLALATIPALLTLVLYSTFGFFLKGKKIILAVLGTVFIANIEVFYQYAVLGKPIDSHLFWLTSRIFTHPTFGEYPLWSYLFGDLHAHVMALPFLGIVVLCSYVLLICEWGRPRVLVTVPAVVGVVWGSLFHLNTWDFISAAVCIGCAFLMSIPRDVPRSFAWPEWRLFGAGMISRLFSACLIAGVAAVLVFWAESRGATKVRSVHYAITPHADYNSLVQLIRMYGAWLLPLLGSLWLLVIRTTATFWSLLPCLTLSLWAGFSHYYLGIIPPWYLILLASLLLGGAYQLLVQLPDKLPVIVGGYLLTCICVILICSESFVLIDRMNTVFKFQYPLWILFAPATWCYASVLYKMRHKLLAPYQRFKWGVALSLPVVVSLWGAVVLIDYFATQKPHWAVEDPFTPTLDGSAHMKALAPDDALIIDWLNKYVDGVAVILEANGPSYQRFTRIATHTGLPTVLGWEYHVYQRGTSWHEIKRRKDAIKQIYEGKDLSHVKRLLDRFGISYIVWSSLERQQFPDASLQKFFTDNEFIAHIATVINAEQVYLFEYQKLDNRR